MSNLTAEAEVPSARSATESMYGLATNRAPLPNANAYAPSADESHGASNTVSTSGGAGPSNTSHASNSVFSAGGSTTPGSTTPANVLSANSNMLDPAATDNDTALSEASAARDARADNAGRAAAEPVVQALRSTANSQTSHAQASDARQTREYLAERQVEQAQTERQAAQQELHTHEQEQEEAQAELKQVAAAQAKVVAQQDEVSQELDEQLRVAQENARQEAATSAALSGSPSLVAAAGSSVAAPFNASLQGAITQAEQELTRLYTQAEQTLKQVQTEVEEIDLAKQQQNQAQQNKQVLSQLIQNEEDTAEFTQEARAAAARIRQSPVGNSESTRLTQQAIQEGRSLGSSQVNTIGNTAVRATGTTVASNTTVTTGEGTTSNAAATPNQAGLGTTATPNQASTPGQAASAPSAAAPGQSAPGGLSSLLTHSANAEVQNANSATMMNAVAALGGQMRTNPATPSAMPNLNSGGVTATSATSATSSTSATNATNSAAGVGAASAAPAGANVDSGAAPAGASSAGASAAGAPNSTNALSALASASTLGLNDLEGLPPSITAGNQVNALAQMAQSSRTTILNNGIGKLVSNNLQDEIIKNVMQTVPSDDLDSISLRNGALPNSALSGVVADTDLATSSTAPILDMALKSIATENLAQSNASLQATLHAPSQAVGAAQITAGQNAPIPNESVVPNISTPKEGGLLRRLASFFGRRDNSDEIANASTTPSNSAHGTNASNAASAAIAATNNMNLMSKEALQALSEQSKQSALRQNSLDSLINRLQSTAQDGSLPSPVQEQAQKLIKALQNPVADLHSVSSWLNFVTGPLSPSSPQALALHQWAFMLLCIRFEQIGKDINKFLKKAGSSSTNSAGSISASSARSSSSTTRSSSAHANAAYTELSSAGLAELAAEISKNQNVADSLSELQLEHNQELLQDTMSQVERLQQQMQIAASEQPLPRYIPLPACYAGGREGSLSAQRQIDEDGGQSWHLNFEFDLENMGPLQVKVKLRFPDVQISFVAERFETLQKVQSLMPELNQRLKQVGLNSSGSNARLGHISSPRHQAAPEPTSARQKRFEGPDFTADA